MGNIEGLPYSQIEILRKIILRVKKRYEISQKQLANQCKLFDSDINFIRILDKLKKERAIYNMRKIGSSNIFDINMRRVKKLLGDDPKVIWFVKQFATIPY